MIGGEKVEVRKLYHIRKIGGFFQATDADCFKEDILTLI